MSFDNRIRLITTIFQPPFMMLKKGRNSTLSEESISRGTILDSSMVEGYCADLAYVICNEKLKIPYKFVIETKYGNEIGEGGMIGALVTHRADLAIAPLTITAAREKVVDFTQPFMNLGISVMIFKPQKIKPVMLLIVFFVIRKNGISILLVENRQCSPSWLRCPKRSGSGSLFPTFLSILSCLSSTNFPPTNGTSRMKTM
jgi:ABC-type amino acid transport substrate-binding protein